MITGDDPVAVEPLGGLGSPTNVLPLPLVGSGDTVFVALKAFVHEILPALSNRQVVQGEENNVPMPLGPDFVVIVATGRYWLATTTHDYRPTAGKRDTSLSTGGEYNLNFYGPNADDYAQTFAMLFRDLYACDFLRQFEMQPLWAADARQMPLIDDARQYEQRYLVQAHVQFNPTVSTAQQFTDKVALTILEAD